GKTFTGEDIKYVYFDSQHSFLRRYGSGWEFSFQILVSDEGAERFARITEDIPVVIDPKTGESYLEQRIYLFLDDVLMDSLRIGAGLAGQAYSTPQITGGGSTEEMAGMSQRRLQSILSSGALPVEMNAVRVDSISPSLGSQFIRSVLVAALGALLAVSVVISLRYRNWKIVLPILMTSVSEIIIILGVASVIKWTIDLAAIAGIIAAVGTGVDHQIIITDEISSGEEKTFSVKEKIKRAFFIIFGTASTTVAAMIPLGIIGIGVMRGFAITTIIGVLVGIFITRPAYSKVIEKLELV
ncbi:MAG: protein translocase subunit SecD, partial [archaeon]